MFAGSKLEELYKYRKKCSHFPHSLLRRYAIFSEMFTREELEMYLLGSTNMKPLYPIDFSINKEDLREAVKFPVKKECNKHIFLEMKGILWGSIHVALIKQ